MNYLFFLIPLLSALACWSTVRLLVWFLFHPVKPRRIFGLNFQGLVPAKQKQLAAMAAREATGWIAAGKLGETITEQVHFEQVRPLIEEHMDHFLRHKLQEKMPMIAMFIGDKTIDSLKGIFIEEIGLLFPGLISSLSGNLRETFKPEDMIRARLSAIAPDLIEKTVRREFARPLRLAGLFAALLGLVTGLVQVGLLLLR